MLPSNSSEQQQDSQSAQAVRAATESFLQFWIVTLGVPGMLVLLQFSQLSAQMLAEKNPRQMLALPGAYWMVRAALCVETLGIALVTRVVFFICERMCCGGLDKKEKDLSGVLEAKMLAESTTVSPLTGSSSESSSDTLLVPSTERSEGGGGSGMTRSSFDPKQRSDTEASLLAHVCKRDDWKRREHSYSM